MADRVADAGHSRQRAVLAVLLLELGRVVPTELLVDRVWGEAPPASGRNVLYGYVARLRAVIAGAADPQVALTRRPGGYLLQARAEQLDLCRFRRLAAEAAAASDGARAEALLREALGLWRGPPLAGLDSPWLRRMRDTLEAERFAAVLDLNDIRLRHGEHGALAGELAGQAAACPADERLIGQLMLALYRSGRPAEALRWFEQTRQRLADELGAHPGPGLRALHQQILRADPSLTVPAPGGLATPVPRQLPADVPAFTGRAGDLAALTGLLDRVAEPAPGTIVISAIGGTAGVGKTALAVHWAHQVADRFPDGQLYVNLRGYDPEEPMPATEALAGFLQALGVTGPAIPADVTARAAMYRSVTAGRRLIVVLDNACDAEQVRSLLPGGAECLVIVTSRDALAGLVAREGAHALDLDLLPHADGVALLRALIGARAQAGDDAVARLATLCCRLPLALRVAAELVVARGDIPMSVLADELTDVHHRLDVLDAGGDERTAVQAVLSWSYRHLDAAAARTFCLLGLHPGQSIDLAAAAALADVEPAQAARHLGRLLRAHLLEPGAGESRYGMHDLLRSYARDHALAQYDPDQRRAALGRLFDYYLRQAADCTRRLFPARYRSPPAQPTGGTGPTVAERIAARSWFDHETGNLAAISAIMTDQGYPCHATSLAGEVAHYLQEFGRYQEATSVMEHAIKAARSIGNSRSEAVALTALGYVAMQQGLHAQAVTQLTQALGLFRQAADQAGAADAHSFLGVVHRRQGRYGQAAGHQQLALALYREIGYRWGEAVALTCLGVVEHRQGRPVQATRHLQQAEALYRELNDPTGQAEALTRLGVVECQQGHHQQAAHHHRQAILLFQQIGHLLGEAEALNGLGETMFGMQHAEQARACHNGALTIARQTRDRDQQARALHGLGRACLTLGSNNQGRDYLRAAQTIYDTLGAPEARHINLDLNASKAAPGPAKIGEMTGAAHGPDTAIRPQSAPPASGSSIPEQIRSLSELHASGILTDDEFSAKKAELLARI